MKPIPRLGERVVVPRSALSDFDEAGTPQVREMSRRGGLRDLEHAHQVAHTHLTILQEMENPQPRAVRERPKQPIDGDTGVLKHDAEFSVRRHMNWTQSCPLRELSVPP